MTLNHHAFELRRSSSHPSVVILNLTLTSLPIGRLSYRLDYGGVITQGFRGPFLLNSSCHEFEKSDKGRKMIIQLWLHMEVYLEPDTTQPTSRKIVVSYDMGPDL